MHSSAPFIKRMLCITLLLVASVAWAQDAIVLPTEITSARNTLLRVVVNGTLSAGGHTRVVMDYPADVIKIRQIVGGSGYAFNCNPAVIAADTMVTSTEGRIVLECWDTKPTTNAPLFALDVEFLSGPGTTGVLRVIRVDRDKVPVENVQLTSSKVTALGSPATSVPEEGITGNYPNPFVTNSVFVFRLTEPSAVSLAVLTVDGRKVLDLGTISATAGENQYQLTTNSWELATGPYVMLVETETHSYLHQFMVLK